MNSSGRECRKIFCRATVLLLLCALSAGCRNAPYVNNQVDTLTAEMRTLEDQIYELEYDYERTLSELKDAHEEVERLRGGSGRRESSPRRATDRDDEESLNLSPPTSSEGEPFDPIIEMPDDPPDEEGGSLEPPGGESLPPPGNSGFRSRPDREAEAVSAPIRLEPGDPRITHIHIDSLRTGGTDFDDEPGDDGISLVIEPRNEDNEFVPLAGPLSIVVLDYGRRRDGDDSRLGRWELDAQQVERSMTNNDLERGVHLRLAWSDRKPKDSKLMVAVRYTTADGRTLEAQRDIFVTLPGQLSERWTPRSTTRTADRSEDRINVAREPSETDGASLERRDVRSTVAPASYEAERPTWRPYR